MSGLTGVSLAAFMVGVAHALTIAALVRRLLVRARSRPLVHRAAPYTPALFAHTLLRLTLAGVAALTVCDGGIAAGLSALAGYWLGRSFACAVIAAGWRAGPE